ncbi:MAG: flagellar filament capping protein FliD [bacterium]|nr:flagellar filament capping protein FliD [bacterium]
MPVTMGGLASGMDTDAIIKKLVEVEGKPIHQLEERKKANYLRKDALKVLTKKLNTLDKTARDLYGFNASYNDKLATPSDKSILAAHASRLADNGTNKIEVVQIASTHKITSDQVDGKEKLPSGKFKITVNGESHNIRFKGGTLKSLRERIDEEASEAVTTSYIKTSGDNYLITMQSKISGKKGEIKISGDEVFLKKLGFVQGEKSEKKDDTNLIFDKRYFTSYIGNKKIEKENGTIQVSEDGKKVSINGLLWREYTLPLSAEVKKDTTLEFNFTYKKPKELAEEKYPFKVELGPEEKILVKGIVLKGYNISRMRPSKQTGKEKQFDSILGVGVVTLEKGKRVEKLYPIEKDAKGKQELPIGKIFAGKKINKVIVYCNEGKTELSGAKIVTPVKDKEGLFQFKNEIAKPVDAKIKVDGIEVVRDKNTDLKDIIKGVTLTIKSPSKRSVDVRIEPDLEKSVDKIKKFVEAYNDYIDIHKELVKAEVLRKPTSMTREKRKRGLFVADMTIIRLENTVKRTIGAAYPTRADVPIKILAQIGVSTGAIRSSWEKIKEGKLVIDENLLKKTIRENPEGVNMFFGSDTDGDNRSDNGMAFTLVNKLRPYITSGRNIIITKMDLEDESIKRSNDQIGRKKEHLARYEQKLRKKFGKMEQAISGAKAQKMWMNNQMGGSRGEK